MRTFTNYNHAEVGDIGRAFIREFAEHAGDADDTEQFTEAVLDWFAETAPATGVVVDAAASRRSSSPGFEEMFDPGLKNLGGPSPRRNRSKECLVDLAHYRFRDYAEYRQPDYWKEAFAAKAEPEALLVLESEWGRLSRGRARRSNLNIRRIFDDASKLFAIAARVKVVVFASHSANERTEIRTIANRMSESDYTQTRAKGAPVWLWLDLPWCDWKEHPPGGWIATARATGTDL